MIISCHLWSSLIGQIVVTVQLFTVFVSQKGLSEAVVVWSLSCSNLRCLGLEHETQEGHFFNGSWTVFMATEDFRSDFSSSPSGRSHISFSYLAKLVTSHTLSHKSVTNLSGFKRRGIRLHHLMRERQGSRGKCGMKNVFVDRQPETAL